jgi:lysozyme family protein
MTAQAAILEPFIKGQEGGLSRNTFDPASKLPCPFSYNNLTGWHTNKGITWQVWSSIHGSDKASADRFFAMSDPDWLTIYKPLFWDKACGDKMKSQRIANIIVDWVWASGQYSPEKDTQEILNHIGGRHLIDEDGAFGDKTIDLMNSEDENEVYNELVQRRLKFIDDIIALNSKLSAFKTDWVRRVNDLAKFNLKFA